VKMAHGAKAKPPLSLHIGLARERWSTVTLRRGPPTRRCDDAEQKFVPLAKE